MLILYYKFIKITNIYSFKFRFLKIRDLKDLNNLVYILDL